MKWKVTRMKSASKLRFYCVYDKMYVTWESLSLFFKWIWTIGLRLLEFNIVNYFHNFMFLTVKQTFGTDHFVNSCTLLHSSEFIYSLDGLDEPFCFWVWRGCSCRHTNLTGSLSRTQVINLSYLLWAAQQVAKAKYIMPQSMIQLQEKIQQPVEGSV